MTPAINLLKKKNISFKLHEYQRSPNSQSYGLDAAEKIGVEPQYVFKTLVAQIDHAALVVAIIPVNSTLNLKQLAKAANTKKAHMAKPQDVLRSTGYVLGGVSPISQKKSLATFIDSTACQLSSIYISGGRRGLDIELSPNDLYGVTQAKWAILTL
ncbi:Cys-tRNA(Pro) deacylase [Shewanella surugensis]|uniref:Cys-tRNA(Pro)/Cys-tRNA(Cys) deacylase n=1 Tax=Shewanella surugensis TaxID=212020 RepID=A0ABT0LCH9_9GAMM|nr:Cys-tRNA(Pro) deacylase [Shewanella surugensis]MCL1125360.1 Cys-tRNA(Pro) deacylase [Shewanella surugensis]